MEFVVVAVSLVPVTALVVVFKSLGLGGVVSIVIAVVVIMT